MKLFDQYLNNVKTFLSEDQSSLTTRNQKWFSASNTELTKAYTGDNLVALNESLVEPYTPNNTKVLLEYDPSIIGSLFGENQSKFNEIVVGSHPDFKYLKYNETIKHHCVSMFLDIRGSTNLLSKYPLEKVRQLKDSILTLSIYVAHEFGGHVQRLQGDGIFLQFVRKDKISNDSIINALNAASILTHFISNDFAEILKGVGIEPLKIRTGIDFGDDNSVLWSYYGIPSCNELTTTSLHTDLASKLQAKASANSIFIGDNIQKILDLKEDFYKIVEKDGKPIYYISNTYQYRFFEFCWQTYLLTHPFIIRDSIQKLSIDRPNIHIRCTIILPNGKEYSYYPNSFSIPKHSKIKYILYNGNSPYYINTTYEETQWHAINSGSEAKIANELEHNFGREFHDKSYCDANAGYLGHHYVQCKIINKRDPKLNKRISFPIFVQ